MKVAHLIPSFGPVTKGGAEIHIHNICKKLNEKGNEAILITVENPYLKLEDLPYKVVFLKKNVSRLLKYLPFLGRPILFIILGRLQKQFRFDLWQVTLGNLFSVYSVSFFNRNKIPCVLRCAGEDINRFPEIGYGLRLNPKFDALVRKYYTQYDALIALTPSVRQEYLDIGIPEEKIHIIPNGVDFDRFKRVKLQESIRNRYSCTNKTMLILTVGRHHVKKGYKYIPEMAEILMDRGVDFRWVIVGANHESFNHEFPNAEKLNIFTTQLSNNGGSDTLPPNELIEFYKSADIFVFPSLLETFGMVLVEAMAAELPIVATTAPGVNDVIDDGENGVKVQPADAKLMANKILEIMDDDKLRNYLSGCALETAKNFYDWDIVLNKYISLYNVVLRQ